MSSYYNIKELQKFLKKDVIRLKKYLNEPIISVRLKHRRNLRRKEIKSLFINLGLEALQFRRQYTLINKELRDQVRKLRKNLDFVYVDKVVYIPMDFDCHINLTAHFIVKCIIKEDEKVPL